jgi:transposase
MARARCANIAATTCHASDLTEAEYAEPRRGRGEAELRARCGLAGALSAAAVGGTMAPMQDIVNAVLDAVRAGLPRRMVPKSFPPEKRSTAGSPACGARALGKGSTTICS